MEDGGWGNRTVLRKSLPRMINQSARNKGKSMARRHRVPPPEENNKADVLPDYLKDLICSAASNVDKDHTNRMISIDSVDYM